MSVLEKLAMAIEHYKIFPTKQNKEYIVKLSNMLEVTSEQA